MLTIYIILLLLSGLNPGSTDRNAVAQDQFLTHLNEVELGSDVPFHLWYIIKMIEVHDDFAELLNEELDDVLLVSAEHPVRCLFRDGVTNRSTGELFHQAYVCTGDGALLVAALYEADETLRVKLQRTYANELETIRNESKSNAALINKALRLDYDPSDLFKVRSFTLPDVYTFSLHSASQSDNIEPLIYQWERELLQSVGVVRPSEALKMKTVVTALHLIISDYGRVHRLSLLAVNRNNISDTHPTQVMLKRLAFAATVGGYFQTALDLYRSHLLPLSKAITDEEEYLKVTIDYANILFRLGNYNAALQTYREVYHHPWQIEDSRYRAALLNNLAVSYLNAGFFEDYLSLQLQSYEQAISGGAVQTQLRSLTNLYIYHWRNQDWVNAIRYLNEALVLAQRLNLDRETAEINILFSTYYSNHLKDYEKALQYVDAALDVIDPDRGFNMLVSAYIEKATILMNLQRYEEAISVNKAILEEVVRRDDPRSEFDLNTQLVNLLVANRQYEQASPIVKSLQTVPLAYLSLQQRSLLTNALVQYNRVMNSGEHQLELLRSTVSEIIRAVRLSGDLQSGFIRLEAGYELTFILLIDELIDHGYFEEAIIWLDDIKNLNKAAFVNSSLLKSSVLSEEEFLYDVQLTNRIDRIRSEILRASDNKLGELNRELLQLLNEKNQFNNRVLTEYDAAELNVNALRRQLKSGEQILSYQAIDSVMYIVSILRGSTALNRKVITSSMNDNARAIIQGLRNNSANLHELHNVYREFAGPYLAESTNRLFLIPDGFMYQIPLEILPRNLTDTPFQFGRAKYLIEDMSISYQNSLSDLLTLKSRKPQNGYSTEYLGVGISEFNFAMEVQQNRNSRFSMGNLPYAKTEIEESYRILKDLNPRVKLLDNQGTVNNVLEHITSSRIVHIASHSLVYDTDPLFSVIQLYGSADAGENGQLHAYELFAYDIRSELVVLSSCDSGSGSFISGSGIIGLGRSLKYAGAKSLILNLWSIRDQAAATLMTDFYSHLGKTGNKDEALRKAKLDFLNSTNSNPAVWGSLILFGDPGPLYTPFPWMRALLLTITLLVALALFRIYRK
ncbi:MAG: CHAT domain-containing protein [Balneolales bacterium]|nr:CHAT domain-containing protein [Balneolales bacterium]